MGEPQKYYAKGKKIDTKKMYYKIQLYKLLEKAKLQ